MSTALSGIREVVPTGEFVILDTETTGVGYRAEIVQIAIVDAEGHALLDSYVQPTCRIPPDATAIHGIDDSMVEHAPTIVDLEPAIRNALEDRTVIIYNAEYDMRLLKQSSWARGRSVAWRDIPRRWLCAMLAYAEHRREPGRTYGEYRWHRLEAAARYEGIACTASHSALGDCLTTLELVRRLAGS